jgi:hypothetical protein
MNPIDLTTQKDTTQQTARAEARSQKKSQSLEIKAPDPEAWKNLVHDLKLSADQSNALRTTIRDVIAELKLYEKTRSERPQRAILVERLMLMEEAFRGLQLELNRSADLMIDFLPFDTLERIGNSLTFTAMGEALGKNVFPRNTTIFIDGRPAKANQITMATLEDHHAPQRRALGLNHGIQS